MCQRILISIWVGLFSILICPAQSPWSSPLQTCWTYPLGEEIERIASDNDSIFIHLPGQILLINNNGQFLWKNFADEKENPLQIIIKEEQIFELSLSSPVLNRITISAISKKTGLNTWVQTVGAEINRNNPPTFTIDQQKLILLNQNEIFYLDLTDGALLNKINLGGKETNKSVMTDDTIFLSLGENKLAVYPLTNTSLPKIFQTPTDLIDLIASGENFLLADQRGQIFFFEKDKQLWKAKLGGQAGRSYFNQQNIAISSTDNFLYQFTRKEGKTVWKKRFTNRISTFYDQQNSIFLVITNNEGKIDIINPKDGATINQINLPDETLDQNSNLFIKNNVLIMAGKEKIYALSPNSCQ
jgi:outer membrane protein assembly factor BamB